MGRRRKLPAPSNSDHAIMRRNIEVRLRVMFPRTSGVTQQYEALAKLSGMAKETVRRLMTEDSTATLHTISKISSAIGVSLPELFTDPDQTQE